MLVDSAVRSGRLELARTLLGEATAAWTVGAKRRGYARALAANG
jgi:hypothetical protein